MRNLASVLLLSLTLLTVPAMATIVFDNFPISGQIGGWPIYSPAFSVSSSFIVPEDATINRVNFGALLTPGDSVVSVDWVIGEVSNGTLGPVVASGTGFTSGGPIGNNGFDVDWVSFSIPDLRIDDGTLYYLTLLNAVSANEGGVYWDENDGPKSTNAWYTTDGNTSPISDGNGGCYAFPPPDSGTAGTGTCSESFQLESSPEPSTWLLIGSGILAVFLRRRRKAVRP